MRKFIILLSFFVGTLNAQSQIDSIEKPHILPIIPSMPKEPRNEIAIANFFPMIFQQTWGGNMGAIYKRYLKHDFALRFHLNGSVYQTYKTAFDNNALATRIGDEYNNLVLGNVNYNVGVGVQKGFFKDNRLSVYQFLDLFKGGYSYNQITANSISEVYGPKGRTIVQFYRYETGQSNISYSLNYGLGLNYNFTKYLRAQVETNIQGSINKITVLNQRKTIDLNISDNSYYVSKLEDTKTPDFTTTNFNLTPTTTLYFSYIF
jgi:hypothetical protein